MKYFQASEVEMRKDTTEKDMWMLTEYKGWKVVDGEVHIIYYVLFSHEKTKYWTDVYICDSTQFFSDC